MLQAGYGGMMDKKQGKELRKNFAKEAFEFFSPKAELGDPNALFELGQMYRMGDYVAKDAGEAIIYLKRAKNHTIAQFFVGDIYLNGAKFVPRNRTLGIQFANFFTFFFPTKIWN